MNDAVADARSAGLRWVTDSEPGIQRLRCGPGFRYVRPDGSPLGDRHTLARIRALAIPPAWIRVWICERADGHIQATGYDGRRRKQYRYHADWRRARDESKYERLKAFARRLPALRTRVRRDLARPCLDREKVLAAIVRLLETTCIRVGNEEYTRSNGSFGLTTLRDRHVTITPAGFSLRFRGKGGRVHEVDVADRRLARIIRSCQELPGQELYQYADADGTVRAVGSADVNAYLREVTGGDFTAKDLRTWAGTVLAAKALAGLPVPRSRVTRRRAIVETVTTVARELRNTPAVCRKCYIHPAVFQAFENGAVSSNGHGRARRAGAGLRGIERAVFRLLDTAEQGGERKAG